MEPFLKYVAQDIVKDYIHDMDKVAVVFPNKRASLFLNEELMAVVGHPVWSPTYITISDLFRRHSNLQVADSIKLICDLHKTFVECTQVDETLDHFYGWGQLLLADFDDIDKNLGDAKQIFFNIENLHALDDDSYLTDEQRKILKKFFGNFHDGHDTELKKRFMQLWSKLGEIYTRFNQRLEEQGLVYEGALYRKVAENTQIDFEHEIYLFVGFNMMQKVELKLYDQLKAKAECHFYWDYDKYYVDDKKSKRSLDRTDWNIKNEAGHYISKLMTDYDNKLAEHPEHDAIYDNMSHPKDIRFISAPTENIQARYVYHWLLEKKHLQNGEWVERYKAGRKTAIVLSDESLLPSVIHSLPQEVQSVNITLGYPLQQTPFFSLIQQVVLLQTLGHQKSKDTYRLLYVRKVLSHPYAHLISEQCHKLLDALEDQKLFYPTREELCLDEDEGLKLLFSDLEITENFNLALMDYLVSILRLIGTHTQGGHIDALFQESLYRTYTLINRLRGLIASGDLIVDIITLQRLVQQLFQTTSIPFHGEPAKGVQIMGVLETRNLDFDHILVLSCNEGNWPKGVSDSSFIPYSVRKANGLTTIDNKVAIYAYHFLSLIQRASDITLTYNNATEDGHTGEMSRFMLQLLVESKHRIVRQNLTAGQSPDRMDCKEVHKDEKIMAVLNKPHLITPTYLNTYLRCQKRFYYKYIMGLEELEELEDEIDNRIFGNIFHRAAQLFYLKAASPSDLKTDDKGEVTLVHPIVVGKDLIEQGLKNQHLIPDLVDEAFREELFKVSNNGRIPSYNGLQLINRAVIISYLKQLLNVDMGLAPFVLKGLELRIETTMEFDTADGKKALRLGGFIDRLDAISTNGNPGGIRAERIRVIDYKTGKTPSIFPKNVESLFSPDELSKHTDYYLQAMLYSLIVSKDKQINPAGDPVSPALLFIQQSGAKEYDPILKFGKELIADVTAYEDDFREGLNGFIADIYNPSLPFVPTNDKHRCEFCPYSALCQG